MYFVEEKYRESCLKFSPHSFLSRLGHSSDGKYIFMCAFICVSFDNTTAPQAIEILRSVDERYNSPYRLRRERTESDEKSIRLRSLSNRSSIICRCKGNFARDPFGVSSVFLAITRGVELTLKPTLAAPSTIFITDAIVTQVDAFIPFVLRSRLRSFVSAHLSVVRIFIFICSVSV